MTWIAKIDDQSVNQCSTNGIKKSDQMLPSGENSAWSLAQYYSHDNYLSFRPLKKKFFFPKRGAVERKSLCKTDTVYTSQKLDNPLWKVSTAIMDLINKI